MVVRVNGVGCYPLLVDILCVRTGDTSHTGKSSQTSANLTLSSSYSPDLAKALHRTAGIIEAILKSHLIPRIGPDYAFCLDSFGENRR
jgi:hypothetical protein